MVVINKLSKPGVKIIYKLKHRKGHGIHSPFVFNLITKVIEEKNPYYRYEWVQQFLPEKKKSSRKNLLYFRLANYFNIKKSIYINSGTGFGAIYLTAPFSDANCICIENSAKEMQIVKRNTNNYPRIIEVYQSQLPALNHKQDCIVINLKNLELDPNNLLENIKTICHDKTLILCEGIRTNSETRKYWKKLCENPNRTTVLDLFQIGIIFFDKELYRWKYQISF